MTVIKPTVVYKLFDGKVTVLIFGRLPCDLEKSHIMQIASDLKLKHIYQPKTHTFNAKICRKTDFTDVIETNGVKIHTGALADGVGVMGQNDTVWLRTADCPTIIAYHTITGEMVVAHAGRASLIDEKHLRNGQAKRQPESIAQAIHQHLVDFWRQTSIYIEVFSCCGIGPMQFRHSVNHPQYGPFNQKMNRHVALNYGQDCFLDGKVDCGALNLHRLIGNQFSLCGVPGDNIRHDSINTARDRDRFFSRRDGDKIGHNTILVIRRS